MSRRTVKLSKTLQHDLSFYALAASASGVSVLSLAPCEILSASKPTQSPTTLGALALGASGLSS
jgi:hypothetical protein